MSAAYGLGQHEEANIEQIHGTCRQGTAPSSRHACVVIVQSGCPEINIMDVHTYSTYKSIHPLKSSIAFTYLHCLTARQLY